MKIETKKNPIISKLGVCDPHVHIFRDKLYLYATHDTPDPSGKGGFHMVDWEIWSTDDAITWEK